MDDQAFEDELRQLLRQDRPAKTQGFREDLLERCLNVLDEDIQASQQPPAEVLGDADLEFLAAAGDLTASSDVHDDDRQDQC